MKCSQFATVLSVFAFAGMLSGCNSDSASVSADSQKQAVESRTPQSERQGGEVSASELAILREAASCVKDAGKYTQNILKSKYEDPRTDLALRQLEVATLMRNFTSACSKIDTAQGAVIALLKSPSLPTISAKNADLAHLIDTSMFGMSGSCQRLANFYWTWGAELTKDENFSEFIRMREELIESSIQSENSMNRLLSELN